MNPVIPHLQRGFDYDLWANLRWLEWTAPLPDPAHAINILTHVANAQRIWLRRLERDEPAPEDQPLAITFARHAELWKSAVSEIPLDTVFHWKRILDGEERSGALEDIARHVINHGTYHRGHLRGLADAAGLDHFEDTDFARYFDIHPK